MAASEQLKELNEKLEIQKVAVTEKSEACEKLLVEIQRATELANEKKAMAVGKREEIAEQNKEIVVEKAEAEEALALALPALEEAKLALQDLDKSDVTEIRCVWTDSTLTFLSFSVDDKSWTLGFPWLTIDYSSYKLKSHRVTTVCWQKSAKTIKYWSNVR